jgi:hypothetical protein
VNAAYSSGASAKSARPLQRDLIVELHVLGRNGGTQRDDRFTLRIIPVERCRHGLSERDTVQQSREILQRGLEVQAALLHLIGKRQQPGAITLR